LSGRELLRWIGMKRGELGHMAMSPPCQGFSTANTKKKANDPRNDLCFEAARLIVECQPQTIFLENVPMFRKSKQFEMFQDLLRGGEKALETFEQLLPAHPLWPVLLSEPLLLDDSFHTNHETPIAI
jgi:site-specific DNA-cytosine methylase